ncbi:hypothetical protein WR25_01984 [Diploscapter pachys]|uniref:Uncharacterized protein n=1 Tax=Diploscapter pachys TaxID=2018661 RepID=A0A2A2L4C5_9BILA|nr:hypothetical protein WR25_01984 [Diploscapter pachys]
MQNEKVHITVEGLEPNALYRLVMSLEHLYGKHKAFAVFKADDSGYIDLKRDAPLRGTYAGADPMGLFLSQRATPDFPYGGYLRCTPPIPFYYDLELYDLAGNHMETMTIKKHWMHPQLKRTEIESHGFYGTEFRPPGDGPYPCVVDISGTGGGLHEHKGSMLASEGFVVLCVAFFQFKDLPSKLEDVDITYFQFKAIVSINGPHSQSHYMSIKENGVQMTQAPFDDLRHYFLNSVMITGPCFASPTENLTPENEVPWERIPKDAKFRLVEVTWAHTIEFFIRNLGEPAHMPDWNRLTHIVKPTIEEQKKFAKQIEAQSQQPQPQQQQQLSKI